MSCAPILPRGIGMQGEASTRLGLTDYPRGTRGGQAPRGGSGASEGVGIRRFAIALGSALIAHLSIGEGPRRSTGSPLMDVSAENRFHVDDGCSVQSFEMSHLQS